MREPGTAIRLKVIIPCFDKVDALFAIDLGNLMALTASMMPPDEGHELGLEMNIGTYIHQSRTEILQHSIEEGATHVLWLDSDMRFPADAFVRLLQRELPIVGINYSKRRFPPEFVALKKIPWEKDEVGIVLETTDDSEGVEEVDALGFGCVLMEVAALANLPDPKHEPWFWFAKTPQGRTIGEDVYFCKFMLQDKLNQRIFVDHDLSKQCAHIGAFEFRCDHVVRIEEYKDEIRAELET